MSNINKINRIHIKDGHLIDPANGIDEVIDIWIADGKVQAVGTAPDGFTADQIINAEQQIVCPGLIDLSARLREPGHEHKATIASETTAAASAGITSLVCPPDTKPVIDSPAIVELMHNKARQVGQARLHMLGALTSGLKGELISEMLSLKNAGVLGMSNANQPVQNSQTLRHAFEYAATHDLTVFIRPNEPSLSKSGCVHEGSVASRLGLPGIPEAAETVAVARELELIAQTGVRAHFSQLSTARAAEMIGRARHDGLKITADVAVHHLYLSEIDIREYDSACHLIPPLRSQRDRDGLRHALKRGVINAICSDHQPHEPDAKQAPFPDTAPGLSGLDTLLPLVKRLADEKLLTLSEIIACVTSTPASILGLEQGQLSVGASADICIFDPNMSWFVSADTMNSRGHNTPFMGWEMHGRATNTLVNGQLVFTAIHD